MTDLTKLADDLSAKADFLELRIGFEDVSKMREVARILRAAGAADVAGLMTLHDGAAWDYAQWVGFGASESASDASRAALESALRVAMAPKPGFVMVPVEPSPEMLNELFRGYTTREQAYRAMIAASQAGAAQEPAK